MRAKATSAVALSKGALRASKVASGGGDEEPRAHFASRIQLPLQTFTLVVGFMVWVILSGLMPFIRQDVTLTSGEVALITAVPVILGSLLRIPIGYWANRFGARIVYAVSLVVLIIPVYVVSAAHSFGQFLIGGLLLGIAGALFSVGVTSLPKYYPKEKHGFINGVYGMGNIGTAVTTFLGPVLAQQFGWSNAIRLYILLLLVSALLVLVLGDRAEARVRASVTEQVRAVYKNEKMWLFSLFYFVTFGSFVAFTVYLPNFMVAQFHLTKVDAGLRTAGFIALATVLRPVGGRMADRWNPYYVLMFVFGGMTIAGVALSFHPSILLYTVGCLMVAVCSGIGNGAVFKLVPLYFQRQAGFVNGLVAAFGGLGGFFPPLILTLLYGMTGHYAIGFMALSEFAFGSFVVVIWMHYQEKLQLAASIIHNTVEGIMVTDASGVIQSINPSFTVLTGFTEAEAIGKTPEILQSGQQNEDFYKKMWEEIEIRGAWQGEILNRRKNGETYLEWLTITAIRDEAGEVKHYAGMFSDMTATHCHTSKYRSDHLRK